MRKLVMFDWYTPEIKQQQLHAHAAHTTSRHIWSDTWTGILLPQSHIYYSAGYIGVLDIWLYFVENFFFFVVGL